MPSALRPLRRWEDDGDLARRFGIAGFGNVLRRTPLRLLNTTVYLDRRDSVGVRLHAAAAEAIHFWAAVLFTPFIVLAATNALWHVVAWFTLAQVVVNVYPMLHLRQVRRRLDRVIHRIDKQRSKNDRARR